MADIDGGSEALSEIDFGRLCRRSGLPVPERQAVRLDGSVRRRYLDATWRRRDGRLLVIEVDGAMHLRVANRSSGQLCRNELSLGGAVVLRYPIVEVREEPALVVEQVRRALLLRPRDPTMHADGAVTATRSACIWRGISQLCSCAWSSSWRPARPIPTSTS